MRRPNRKPTSSARSTSLIPRASRKISAHWHAKRLLRHLATARSCSAAKRSQSKDQRRRRVSSSTCSTASMQQCRPITHPTSRPLRKSATNTRLFVPMPSKADELQAHTPMSALGQSGHWKKLVCPLFDHLIGAGEHSRRECETHCFGRLEIDH